MLYVAAYRTINTDSVLDKMELAAITVIMLVIYTNAVIYLSSIKAFEHNSGLK